MRAPRTVWSETIVGEIEEILELDGGALLGKVPGRKISVESLEKPHLPRRIRQDDFEAFLEDAELKLGADTSLNFRDVSVELVCDVDGQGYVSSENLTLVVQCLEGTLERIAVAKIFSREDFGPIAISVPFGGHVLEDLVIGEGGVIVSAIELAEPLEPGEIAMVNVRVDFPEHAAKTSETGWVVRRSIKKLMLWARFEPSTVPARVEQIEVDEEGERTVLRGLDTDSSVHVLRWNFGPGSMALRWDPAIDGVPDEEGADDAGG
ncbi:hypothetical protein [Arthrobacter sp. NPDC090010]|uniref:hypothetical protein n=1 Tax=Arthrobacter sp. NPDC090010 TaxID=3363942 RepID=UPI0037F9971B